MICQALDCVKSAPNNQSLCDEHRLMVAIFGDESLKRKTKELVINIKRNKNV